MQKHQLGQFGGSYKFPERAPSTYRGTPSPGDFQVEPTSVGIFLTPEQTWLTSAPEEN